MNRATLLRLLVAPPGLVACAGESRPVPVAPCAEIPLAPEPSPALPPAATLESKPEPWLAPACPPGMVALPGSCMDRYESPNVRGEVPFAFATASDGERWCAQQGKRLCYDDEWLRACGGPRAHRFPYGDTHREGACNDDRSWIAVSWALLAKWPDEAAIAEATRLLQADMSGARAECVTDEGVFDMTGNVAEWVRRRGPAPRPGYEHVLKGCYWAGCFKESQPNCAFANRAHPGAFRTYEAGFRCCADRLPRPGETGVTSAQ